MNFLLDTNVVSEWVKQKPNPRVVRWLSGIEDDRVYLSVVTFAELHHGVLRMSRGQRRDSLKSWITADLSLRFEGRILDVDPAVAEAWGLLMAESDARGVNLNVMDALIAATSQVHDLTLVTRNLRHFAELGIGLINPWVDGTI